MDDLKDRVAIVTGAAGGIGGAVARHLAERGARVVATDIAEAPGKQLAGSIGATFLRHDVTDPASWAEVLKAARALGVPTVLVNSAGIEGDIEQGGLATRLADWRQVLAVNLDGTFLGCQAVMPAMLEAGSGAIVNVSSAVSSMATPSGLAYGASKAGVEQLTRSLAVIGARDAGRVRCNSVHPGVIKTRMTDQIICSFAAAQGVSTTEAEAAVCSTIPFKARGMPEEVASLIGYLVSDAASYITGSAFKIDAGWTIVSAG